MTFNGQCLQQSMLLPIGLFLCLASADASAQSSVYRCLGNPVMYTSDQRLAQAKNCALAGGSEPPTRTTPVRRSAAEVATSSQGSIAGRSVTKVASLDSSARAASPEQKSRDSDRVIILTTELREERAKFELLKQKQAKASEPGSTSEDSRADLSKAIARSQSDIAALEREISRTH